VTAPDPSDLERQVCAAVANLRTWKRGERRAPHKPLLLLYALGRLQRGEARLVDFVEAEPRLAELLARFGPSSTSTHPIYPFWHLQTDGLWDVPRGGDGARRGSSAQPLVSVAREQHLEGGFPAPIQQLLQRRPALASELAREILAEHFPESLHDEIAEAAGIDLDVRSTSSRLPRPAGFRDEVLRAYEHQCAICGFQALLDGTAIGVEAAHVRWHAYDGPSVIENGLALCVLHHKFFDLGVLGLAPERTILVSARVSGGVGASTQIVDHAGMPLRDPQAGTQGVSEDYVDWHRREVFRHPARGSALARIASRGTDST